MKNILKILKPLPPSKNPCYLNSSQSIFYLSYSRKKKYPYLWALKKIHNINKNN